MDIRVCKTWQEVMQMAIEYEGDIYFTPADEFITNGGTVEMRTIKNTPIDSLMHWFTDDSHICEMICIWPELVPVSVKIKNTMPLPSVNMDQQSVSHPSYKAMNYS